MWPSSQHAIEWTLTSRIIIIMIFLAFWSYKITLPFGGICRGPWHGPWRQCLIVYTLHTQTLFFSEPSTILLLKILKFPFLDIYLESDNSNLEVCKDHINSTTVVNTISLQFLCLFGYIFTHYYIWKCTQTM